MRGPKRPAAGPGRRGCTTRRNANEGMHSAQRQRRARYRKSPFAQRNTFSGHGEPRPRASSPAWT
eukprot:8158753-Pyramimonas_sp.AAC.1